LRRRVTDSDNLAEKEELRVICDIWRVRRATRQVLAELLALHATPAALTRPSSLEHPHIVDCTYGRGHIWGRLASRPVRIDINPALPNPALPNLDLVADWRNLSQHFSRGSEDRVADTLPIAAIQPSPRNPRHHAQRIAELADSLREHGLWWPSATCPPTMNLSRAGPMARCGSMRRACCTNSDLESLTTTSGQELASRL
jgi:hypothetical protein